MVFLAVDGGGSKTEFLLCGEDGKERADLILDGCNPNDGTEKAKKVLFEGINRVLRDTPRGGVIFCAGISGCAGGENREVMQAYLDGFGFASCSVFGDAEGLIEAGLAGRDGIVLIMGTGSVLYAKRGERVTRMGGWGHLFDFGGDGYSLGRAALYASLCDEDGTGQRTSLRPACEAVLGCRVSEAIPLLYREGKKKIASFAPLLLAEAERGDSAACRLMQAEQEAVTALLGKALSGFGGTGIPCVLCGGLTGSSLFTQPILSAIAPKGAGEILSRRPAEGVMMLAMKRKKVEANA